MLSEAELAGVMHTTKGKGCGPTLTEMSERRHHHNIAGVTRKGQDFLDFGVEPELDETKKRSNSNNKSTDGSEIRKKQMPDNGLNMFENRVEASYDASLIIKVNKSSIINALKRSYLVSNSSTSRTAFNIETGTVPSCTCPDFAKNEHQVLCKHILFIVLHVLNGKDLEPSLRIHFIKENDLRSLFDAAGKDIKRRFLREQSTSKRKDFHAILAEHACFTQPQIGKVQKKCKWLAKCTNSCYRKVINVRTKCIAIEGALTVPFNKAVAQNYITAQILPALRTGQRGQIFGFC